MPLHGPAERQFFRGTTEEWEIPHIWGSDDQYPRLRAGKEIVLGKVPPQLSTMTAEEINQEIVNRVGVETALGTANMFSFFVPISDRPAMSMRFGHGGVFAFKLYCVIYAGSLAGCQDYVAERGALPDHVVPLFVGGKAEYLAWTGTAIHSLVQGLPDGSMRIAYHTVD
jgi:hypothetical protein